MKLSPDLARRAAILAGLGACTWLAAGSGRFLAVPKHPAAAFDGLSMGSTYSVRIATAGLSTATISAAEHAVDTALAGVVERMSHYAPASEVSRLNRQPLGEPLVVSAETCRVFEAAQAVQRASGGAFDVALGEAVDAWGFGPSRAAGGPPPAERQRVLRSQRRDAAIGIDPVAGTLTRRVAVSTNLSGIAKGFGVDRAAHSLLALGITDFMVEVGGEVRTHGRHADGRAWRLGIERPDAEPRRALLLLDLGDQALATSGDYRNFFVHQGRRYSHEIDPASAAPVDHALASVSVVAADCMSADAWSTALFVLGPERGPACAERFGLAAHFVARRPDGRFDQTASTAFSALGGQTVG